MPFASAALRCVVPPAERPSACAGAGLPSRSARWTVAANDSACCSLSSRETRHFGLLLIAEVFQAIVLRESQGFVLGAERAIVLVIPRIPAERLQYGRCFENRQPAGCRLGRASLRQRLQQGGEIRVAEQAPSLGRLATGQVKRGRAGVTRQPLT